MNPNSECTRAAHDGVAAALSDERDPFRAQLVADYGSDPEAGT